MFSPSCYEVGSSVSDQEHKATKLWQDICEPTRYRWPILRYIWPMTTLWYPGSTGRTLSLAFSASAPARVRLLQSPCTRTLQTEYDGHGTLDLGYLNIGRQNSIHTRVPQIDQKSEFWCFSLTTGDMLGDPSKQFSTLRHINDILSQSPPISTFIL